MSEDSKASTQTTQLVEGGTEFRGLRVPPPSGIHVQGGQKVPPPPPQARIPAPQSGDGNAQPATPATPASTGGQSPAPPAPSGSTND